MSTKAFEGELVGAKIVDWHSCIIARSVEQAMMLKEECQIMIEQMEANDKVLSYYALVEFRHELLMRRGEKVGESESLQGLREKNKEPFDDLLNYLYYFFSGQNEFFHERYKSAIKMFRKAERLLEHVQDDAEEAEFYYYIGSACYRLNQYPFASSYIEQARLAFDRLGYLEKSISCNVILAGICSETKQHEKAVELLNEALQKANTPAAKGIIYQAIAIDAVRCKEFDKAEESLKRALEFEEHRDTVLGMKSLHILTNTLFRKGEEEEAATLFTKAEAAAIYYRNEEYQARCLATKGLYIKDDLKLVDEALDMLKRHSLEFEMTEVAEETSIQLRNKGDLDKALNYLTMAYNARLNQTAMGVNQS